VSVISAVTLLSIISAEWRPGRSFSAHLRRIFFWLSLAFVAATLGVVIIKAATRGQWDGSPLRALPLVLFALIIIHWRRGKRSETDSSSSLSRSIFVIAAYSLAVLARVALRVPSGGAFGGFFLPTSLILTYYLLALAWPRTIGDRTQNPKIAIHARRVGQAVIGVMVLATAAVFTVRYRANFNYEVSAPRGQLFTTRSVGVAINEALDFIASQTAPDEAIAVLPEGSDLAFLSGRRMPLRHQILIPGLMSERDEQEAIARLQETRVRYVLIVNRPMREFGAESFGRDFDQTLGRWIDEHYHLVQVCGLVPDSRLQIGDPNFFIKIFEKLAD